MKKVLFVCLGNICRSPLAEAIFREKLKIEALETEISCDSAGTAGYHIGENPDPRTIEIGNKHGILVRHKGQQFIKDHRNQFDYLIAMDDSNYSNMIAEMGEHPEKLLLMRDFDPEGKGKNVPDPYYGGEGGFENVYQILDRSLDEFLKFLRVKHEI